MVGRAGRYGRVREADQALRGAGVEAEEPPRVVVAAASPDQAGSVRVPGPGRASPSDVRARVPEAAGRRSACSRSEPAPRTASETAYSDRSVTAARTSPRAARSERSPESSSLRPAAARPTSSARQTSSAAWCAGARAGEPSARRPRPSAAVAAPRSGTRSTGCAGCRSRAAAPSRPRRAESRSAAQPPAHRLSRAPVLCRVRPLTLSCLPPASQIHPRTCLRDTRNAVGRQPGYAADVRCFRRNHEHWGA